MLFQASDSKERNFLELLDDNLNFIELLVIRRKLWLQQFDLSNSLCIRTIRWILCYRIIILHIVIK